MDLLILSSRTKEEFLKKLRKKCNDYVFFFHFRIKIDSWFF